ncbi:MAG: hypothetical protein Q4C54_01825 [Clostridia bacterium]|nr:hypothetical protein [Clostridia bacterium]
MAEANIPMVWHLNDTDPENVYYELIYNGGDGKFDDLLVRIAAAEVTERVARAKLIEMAFNKAREKGLDTTRLRFRVNGN